MQTLKTENTNEIFNYKFKDCRKTS